MTKAEFYVMAAEPHILRECRPMSFGDMAAAAEKSLDFSIKDASGNALLDLAMKKGVSVDEGGFKDRPTVKREDAVELLAGLIK